jgi:phosphoglycolate phosphatase-like HAD superfamily hydrolase
MIGDSESDIIAGASVGCKTILIGGGPKLQLNLQEWGCISADDLSEASDHLLNIMGGAKPPTALQVAS